MVSFFKCQFIVRATLFIASHYIDWLPRTTLQGQPYSDTFIDSQVQRNSTPTTATTKSSAVCGLRGPYLAVLGNILAAPSVLFGHH